MATTRYHDKEFDELLHARWSFVFDLLGIDWEYHWRDPAWLPSDDLAATFYLPSRRTWFRSEEPYGDPVGVEAWEEHMNALESDDPNDRFELDELYDDPVPPEWAQHQYLLCVYGIPNPSTMEPYGPADNDEDSMLMLSPGGGWDAGYQWTRCATCGYVGAEYSGRAERLACGHGEVSDKDYRADDPALLAAYRTARRSVRARWSGSTCASCSQKIDSGNLLLGRPAEWLHASCFLDRVPNEQGIREEVPFTRCSCQSSGHGTAPGPPVSRCRFHPASCAAV